MLATIKSALDQLLDDPEHIYDISKPVDITYDATCKRIANMDSLKSELVTLIHDAFSQKAEFLKKLLPQSARRHNDALAINQLPPEVLALILGFSVPRHPNQDAMNYYHVLAQVCKFWFEVITNDPWFWPLINVTVPGRTSMILKRNKNLPELKLWCETSYHQQVTDFLPVVRESSPRWTYVFVETYSLYGVKDILEQPTTRLTELYVRPVPGTMTTSHYLARLSEGAPFRILKVDNLALSWNSQRLRGPQLESLQLFNLYHDLPTLRQLHCILSSSPNLKWVGLKNWQDPMGGAAGAFRTEDISPISLPCLETLYLEDLPPAYTSHLFARLSGGNLKALCANSVPKSFWDLDWEEEAPLLSLLTGVVAKSKGLKITLGTGGATLRLASDPLPSANTSEWSDHREDTEGFDVTFNTQTLPHSILETFGDFLTSNIKAESISLFLDAQTYTATDDSGHIVPTPSVDPETLVNTFPFVTHVQFGRYYNVGSVLRYLSMPQRGPSGTNDWPWKALASSDVRDVEMPVCVVRDLLHFCQNRMRASAGSGGIESAPEVVPKALEQVFVPQQFSTVFSNVECLKGVVQF